MTWSQEDWEDCVGSWAKHEALEVARKTGRALESELAAAKAKIEEFAASLEAARRQDEQVIIF